MIKTEIVTTKLKLRLIKASDLESIHNLHSLPETDRYNTLGIPKNLEQTRSIINPWMREHESSTIKNYTFAIDTNFEEIFIGLFGLKLGGSKYKSAEVWYKIHPDHWNKGYATESLEAVLEFGFETLQLHRVIAGCAVDNIGSIKVLEKAGLQREGRGRQILPLKTGWSDNFLYSILETDPRNKTK